VKSHWFGFSGFIGGIKLIPKERNSYCKLFLKSLMVITMAILSLYSDISAKEIIYSHPMLEKAFVNLFGYDYSYTVLNKDGQTVYIPNEHEVSLGGSNTILLYTSEDLHWIDNFPSSIKLNVTAFAARSTQNIWTSPLQLYHSLKSLSDTLEQSTSDIEIDRNSLTIWKDRLDILEKQIKKHLSAVNKTKFAEYDKFLDNFSREYELRKSTSFSEWLDSDSLLQISRELLTSTDPSTLNMEDKIRFMDLFEKYLEDLRNNDISVMVFVGIKYTSEMRLLAAKNNVRLAYIPLIPDDFGKLSYEQIILKIVKRLKANL